MGSTGRQQQQPLLPPSSGLPPLRASGSGNLCEIQLLSAIDNLFAIYCPNPAVTAKSTLYEAAAKLPPCKKKIPAIARLTDHSALPDSGYSSPGYVSDDENEDDGCYVEDEGLGCEDDFETENMMEILRADEFERSFAMRWLEKFITRASDEADELAGCFVSGATGQDAIDKAAELLTFLLNPPEEDAGALEGGEDNEDTEDDGFVREMEFPVYLPGQDAAKKIIRIRVNDRLAGKNSTTDHTDVGVQTWGASIVFCQVMCDSPGRFGLTAERLGEVPRIVELGSGTGVVSLVLGQLLPLVLGHGVGEAVLVATDYHPGVMANLRRNITMNQDMGQSGDVERAAGLCRVHACALDWARSELLDDEPDWPLEGGANGAVDVLFATDVVYAKEHAQMLYDCASRLLAADGVFWLLQTVRQNGRFGEYADTVEAVFPRLGHEWGSSGISLKILESEKLEKRSGVGRGDETFYRLFRIGWA